MKVVVIKEEEAQAILNYLASRPYKETFNLIPSLVNASSEEREEPQQEKNIPEVLPPAETI